MIGEIDDNDPVPPQAKLIKIEGVRYSPDRQDPVTYKIIYSLTAGQEDLVDIQIRAITDMVVWDYEISSLNSHSSSINVARLKALDPDSISGEIIGYTIRQ